MKGENIGLALLIARSAGLFGRAKVSTSGLAAVTGFSQQSVSRKLRELESEGAIQRQASNSGIEVSFTEKGRRELESLYRELNEVFSRKPGASLEGKVVSGMGEGKYYTSLAHYESKFSGILGKKIFHGTLNLEVNPSQRLEFTSVAPAVVEGFSTKERAFGGIDCWKCNASTAKGREDVLAILPHRTNHPKNIIELVAASGLRKKLGLEDGSKVKLAMA